MTFAPQHDRESQQPSARWWTADGWSDRAPTGLRGVLSGSFNPLHEGHIRLQDVAASILEGPIAFELSRVNVDKPALDEQEVNRRSRQFSGQLLVVTSAPTFVEKSRLFGGLQFVVGADTAQRIVAPRFYGNSVRRMHDALAQIAGHRCGFLVAARWWDNRLLRVDDLEIPGPYTSLFQPIPAACFRLDTSSTDLRQSP